MTRQGRSAIRSLSPLQRRGLILAALILFVENLFYVGVLPLLPFYAEKFDLSPSGVGIVVGSYAAGLVAGSLPAAVLGARIGFRRLAATGVSVLAPSTAGFAFAESVVVLDAFRVVQGLGAGFAFVGALGWTASIAPVDRRGLIMGLVLSVAVTGSVVGPVVGALASATSIEGVFGVLAIVQLVLGLYVFAQPEAPPPVEAATAPRRPPVRIRLLVMTLVAAPATLAGIYEVLTPLLLDDAGVGTAAIAAVFGTAAVAEVVGGPLVGRLSDTYGRVSLLCGALVAAPAGCLVLTAASGQAALVALAVLAWVAITSGFTPALALVADISGDVGSRGAGDWALLNVFLAGGILVGSTLGPVIAERLGEPAPYLIGSAGCVVVIVLALRHRQALQPFAVDS